MKLMIRAGDVIEVRSQEEILKTLGPDGRLYNDRLPFMPEMLQYCGRRFRVAGVAHKTCDSATFIMGRRMRDAVFLEDLRCDGSAHGSCQARCLLFWKTQWLKPVEPSGWTGRVARSIPKGTPSCSERQLHDATSAVMPNGETRYFCQATEHWAATEPIRPMSISHFVEDIRTRNATLGEVAKVIGLHFLWRLRLRGRGYRLKVWIYDRIHKWVTGRPDPFREGTIPEGAPTPDERLDLRPGELVEVKTHDEILHTINRERKNRGMTFDPELTPACGQRFRVAHRVNRIIEEKTGRMLTMKSPCITLEGVYCRALYVHYSLLCSRRATPYFREIWLKRVALTTRTENSQDDKG